MVKKRRVFTREFKVEAVRLASTEGMTIARVPRDLGVGESSLYRWKAALAASEEAFPGKGRRAAEDEELDRLRRENRRLRMERDFLRKAAAYFAKEPE